MKKRTIKEEKEVFCDECNEALTKTEQRVYNEGIYKIDPNGDERKMCFNCKERSKNASSKTRA